MDLKNGLAGCWKLSQLPSHAGNTSLNFEHSILAALGLSSTTIGNCLGTPGAAGIGSNTKRCGLQMILDRQSGFPIDGCNA